MSGLEESTSANNFFHFLIVEQGYKNTTKLVAVDETDIWQGLESLAFEKRSTGLHFFQNKGKIVGLTCYLGRVY